MGRRLLAWLVLFSIGLTGSACDKKSTSASIPPTPFRPESMAILPPSVGTPPSFRISADDAEWIFHKTLQRHRHLLMTPGRCGFVSSWMSYEYEQYRTEGRLFARAYPALAERLSLEVLNDPEAPVIDRGYAWYVLGLLAPRTSPALEKFVAEQATIVDDDNRYEQDAAIMNLAERRFDERCLALCRAEARKGNSTAISYLTQIEDPEAIALFREMTRWDEDLPYPLGGLPEQAEHLLKRIAILQSKDWEAQIARIITGPRSEDFYLDIHWALAVAKRRNMPGLQAALKKRLEPSREDGRPGRYPERFRDQDYDRVLIAYMDAGGILTADEEIYLWKFGFRGDSEARLLELMTERSKYGR